MSFMYSKKVKIGSILLLLLASLFSSFANADQKSMERVSNGMAEILKTNGFEVLQSEISLGKDGSPDGLTIVGSPMVSISVIDMGTDKKAKEHEEKFSGRAKTMGIPLFFSTNNSLVIEIMVMAKPDEEAASKLANAFAAYQF